LTLLFDAFPQKRVLTMTMPESFLGDRHLDLDQAEGSRSGAESAEAKEGLLVLNASRLVHQL
jgi:hypothetical protein